MASIRPDQEKFTYYSALLVLYIHSQGYTCTEGDTWSCRAFRWAYKQLLRNFQAGHTMMKLLKSRLHKDGSWHFNRLAKDYNLFKDGKYLRATEDHRKFGEYWKSLDPKCTWGGDFKKKDGNHYSYGEK